MFDELYKNLKDGFQKSWFRRLFQNTELGKLLAKEENPSAWEFFNTYLSSWWLTRWYFRFCIQTIPNRNAYDGITRSPEILDNFDDILKVLQSLKETEFFNASNCNIIANQKKPKSLHQAFCNLKDKQILTQDNLTVVLAHEVPVDIAEALIQLNDAKILTPENRKIVAKHTILSHALCCLNEAKILTPENRDIVANFVNPVQLRILFRQLKDANILNQQNFDLVTAHRSPTNLRSVLVYLETANILNQDNFAKVVKIDKLGNLVQQLGNLHKVITPNEINKLLMPADIPELSIPKASVHQPASPEYQASLGQYSIWAERHISPQNQHEFDKQYGLVIKP